MPIDTYLAQVIQPLLSKPEKAKISSSTDDMGVLLTLIVAKEDMGPVIGKQGDTAKCIRHLLRIAGIKQGARVSLKINEPDGSPYVPRQRATDKELVAS